MSDYPERFLVHFAVGICIVCAVDLDAAAMLVGILGVALSLALACSLALYGVVRVYVFATACYDMHRVIRLHARAIADEAGVYGSTTVRANGQVVQITTTWEEK